MAIALFALAPGEGALAADWPDNSYLRGSLPASSVRWEGLNFGAQFGVTTMDTDFGGSTGQEVAYILRNTTLENEASPSSWTTLPSNITNSRNYGLFLGYNFQWDGVILGFDIAYNRMSGAEASANDTLSRRVTTSDNVMHDVTITAQSSAKILDYATARLRGGVPIGQFLPYAFIGGAVGRFDYTSTATLTSHETPPAPQVPYDYTPAPQSNNKNGAFAAGVTAGLGIDVAVLPNVFLRAEWEYVAFAPLNGIRVGINSGKVGIGAHF